jgi:imidazolonepropionase-like amidohydrolase
MTREPGFVLLGGTIYTNPLDAPLRDGVIVIEGAKIAAVAPKSQIDVATSARVLDFSSMTIAAGFTNSHVHFFERKWANADTLPTSDANLQLADFLRYGFTSVFDLSSRWENTRCLRDRIASGGVAGPNIRSTGEGLTPPGALPPQPVLRVLGLMETPMHEVQSPAEARESVRQLIAAGVDGIKLFISSPYSTALEPSVIETAVSDAHRASKPVFAHPNNGADVATALRAGVDVIAHTTPHSGNWDETILTKVAQRRVSLTPTLTLWMHAMRHDSISAQRQVVDTAIDQLRAWRANGGTTLFGTDYGAVGADPSQEYALMGSAGMNFRDILAALTTNPAEAFGESRQRGSIASGLEADLVVLNGDPADNQAALTSVHCTIRAGRVVYPIDGMPEAPA